MIRRFGRNQRGNVAMVFGFTAPVLIGMVGAAVDYSTLSARRTELQGIADAAALSAAKVLSTNYAQTSSQREPAAVGRQVFWGMRQSSPSSELLNEHPYR
ncbi:MAG TPA: pilus assembly protein TadG-related protein [Beijerinckiaceae bacterium]|nr:pilus assembly protein TadG-related protein [Beijerinckiaceae bacterium]